jgi:hypothetical protein
MSQFIVASHWTAVTFAAVLLATTSGKPAVAQGVRDSLLVFKEPRPANERRWQALLRGVASSTLDRLVEPRSSSAVAPERLRALETVERRLKEAREQAANLAEHEALASLAQAAARRRALAPAGEFEVRVSAKNAHVFLDEVPQGTAPVRIRVGVGRHVLRVEAAGHHTYGTSIDVLEGERAAVEVALAPYPALEAARALLASAAAGDYARARQALRALERAGSERTLFVLETSRAGDRALLVRCTAASCNEPMRLDISQAKVGSPTAPSQGPTLNRIQLRAARAWLAANEAPTNTDWWRRWYVWGGAALVTAAAVSVIAVSAQPTPTRALTVVVEPPR